MRFRIAKLLLWFISSVFGFVLPCAAQTQKYAKEQATDIVKKHFQYLNKVRLKKDKIFDIKSIYHPKAILGRNLDDDKVILFIERIRTRQKNCNNINDKNIGFTLKSSPLQVRAQTIKEKIRYTSEKFDFAYIVKQEYTSFFEYFPPEIDKNNCKEMQKYANRNPPHRITRMATIGVFTYPKKGSIILQIETINDKIPPPPIPKPTPIPKPIPIPYPIPKPPDPIPCNCDSLTAEIERLKEIIKYKRWGQDYEKIAKLRDSINNLTYKLSITKEKLKECDRQLQESKEYVEDLRDLLSDKEKQLIQLNNENIKQGESIIKLQKNLEAKEQLALVNIGRSEYFQKEYARTRFLHRSHIMLAGNFSLLDASAFNKNIKFQSNNPIAQAFEYSNLRSWGVSVYAKPFPLYEAFVGGIFASNLSTIRDKLPDNFTTIDAIRNTEIALKNAPQFKPTVLERTDGRYNRFNAGIYLHTDKVKLLSHLYLMVGGAFRYGNEWDVYKGNLIKSIPAFSVYSPDIKYYAVKKTDGIKPILGLAIVNPFVQMESGYNWYNKNFFMNIGLNIPISYFKLLYNKDDENLKKSNLKNKANDEYINRND